MIVGTPTIAPRMEAVPVRMPAPVRKAKAGWIYALQSTAKERYFGTYSETAADAR